MLPPLLDQLQAEGHDVLQREAPALGVRAVEAGRAEDSERVAVDFAEQLDYGGPALLRLGHDLREHLDPEADMALFVAGDVAHAFGEAGHRSVFGEEVLDEVLARLGQRAFDHQVVERHRLGVLRQRAVGPEFVGHAVQSVEHPAVAPAELRQGRLERRGDVVSGPEHFFEEPVEVDRVAGLVDLLRGQEVGLLLVGAASTYGERLSATESSP